jgi:anti-anti-sigma factor
MTTAVTERWDLDLQRGPDCLLIKVMDPIEEGADPAELSDRIWSLLEQQFTYRVVIDLAEIDHLGSHMVGQLVHLAQQVAAHGGLMRLCGLSSWDQESLRRCGLNSVLPAYPHREDAIFSDRCCPASPA